MRNPDFCIGSDSPAPCNRASDQLINTIPLLPQSKSSSLVAIFCCCKVRFVLDLMGNYNAAFSHDAAHTCNDTRSDSSVVSVSASYASGSDPVLESTTCVFSDGVVFSMAL